jgi:hypothetical protein
MCMECFELFRSMYNEDVQWKPRVSAKNLPQV